MTVDQKIQRSVVGQSGDVQQRQVVVGRGYGLVEIGVSVQGRDRARVRLQDLPCPVVESLCREAGLVPPQWTEAPACFLQRPWFAGGLENLKAILLCESPVPFRRRNLFVSANALSRA